MEHSAGQTNAGTNGIIDFPNLRDINRTTALLMEEKLQDIQKDINEIISQAVKYREQGNYIVLSGYLAGGIMRLNRNIEIILEMVESIKDMEKQAG